MQVGLSIHVFNFNFNYVSIMRHLSFHKSRGSSIASMYKLSAGDVQKPKEAEVSFVVNCIDFFNRSIRSGIQPYSKYDWRIKR